MYAGDPGTGWNPKSVFGVPGTGNPEQYSGQCQRTDKAGIEYGDENVRSQSGRTQPDTAAHHEHHNAL